MHRAGGDDGIITVHSACAGKKLKNLSLPTLLWVVLESSVWSQELMPSALFSMPSSGSVGLTSQWLACCVTVFSTRAQVVRLQEERTTCLPLTFSTKIHAPGDQSVGASSTCPSRHRSPLFKGIVDPGTQAPGCWVSQRNREEDRGLHAPSGSELSAGAQVQTSPGIP